MKENNKAIGIVEFSSIAQGMRSLDDICKNYKISILQARMICPGKYMVLCGGDYASVGALIQQIKADYNADCALIGNISNGVIKALKTPSPIAFTDAIGILESMGAVTAIEAADAAVKSANVSLLGIRIAGGIAGKCVVAVCGGVAESMASVETMRRLCVSKNIPSETTTITNPCEAAFEHLKSSFVG